MEGEPAKPSEHSQRRDPDDRPPRPPVDRVEALRRAKPPAIALMLVGVINCGLGVFVVVMAFIVGGMNLGAAEGVFGLFNALAGLVIFTGGLNLLKLDAYGLARTGSITAMVPCVSLCLILGLPIGVWALVTASNPDVRAAFRDRRR
jgi:hypothetical protein